MNYQQALDYIYSFINYERSGMPAADPVAYNLERIARLLEKLGNPQLAYPSIVIAGTKGKGSTSAMMAAALQAQGYRVGLYTQPHLHTYRERIVVDGQMITQAELVALVEKIKPGVEEVLQEAETLGRITTYEVGTALVLLHFAEAKVDFAVLEIGLGGRLDAVNVVTPLVSVISSISYDHTQVLGDTLEKIAGEKAGIIKAGGTVITAPQAPAAMAVIEQVCAERKATLFRVGQDFTIKASETPETLSPVHRHRQYQKMDFSAPAFGWEIELDVPLLGEHQQLNTALAAGALLLQSRQPDGLKIEPEALKKGFNRVKWPARLEVLEDQPGTPLVVADGAHNGESAGRLQQALRSNFYFEKLFYLIGTSSDKDIEGIFTSLAATPATFILTRSVHPRAASPETLRDRGLPGSTAPVFLTGSVREGLAQARQLAGPHDLICVTGSLFVAAEARELFGLATESDGRPD